MNELKLCNKNKKHSLSIILPVYNEEDNIKEVVKDIYDFLKNQDMFKGYEIIVVDDGSSDNTAKTLREFTDKISYLKVITHVKNLGYGRALLSGVKNSQYPLVLFMDADGQFNINEIKKVLFYLRNFDIITGYRYKRQDAFYRIILGRIYRWTVFLLFGLRLKDINCGFKLFKKEILKSEDIKSKNGVFYTEVLLRAKSRGYKIKEASIEHFPRLKGKETGVHPRVILNSIKDLIRLKFFLVRRKNG